MSETIQRMSSTEKALDDMRKYEIVEKVLKECDRLDDSLT
jgi:hypothetical protein